eukprot:6867479-Prymnesium_polylepis.2
MLAFSRRNPTLSATTHTCATAFRGTSERTAQADRTDWVVGACTGMCDPWRKGGGDTRGFDLSHFISHVGT